MSEATKKAAHTQTPWKLVDLRHQQRGKVCVRRALEPWTEIAHFLKGNPNALADARLFLAAPKLLEDRADLLAMCEDVLAWMDHANAVVEPEDKALEVQLKTLIARVKGG